ncbi:MAG: hypothetical protein Q9217_003112 [Psora testacea]
MAFNDFNGSMELESFQFPGYTDVRIIVAPVRPHIFIERRYAVWGVYQGIYAMAERNSFVEAFFYLKWEGVFVGIVSYSAPQATLTVGRSDTENLLTARSETAPTLNSTTGLTDVRGGSDASNTSNDDRLKLYYSFGNTHLSIAEAIITVIGALSHAAEFDILQQITPFTSYQDDFDAKIQFVFHHGRPRTTPPFLTYRWISKALEQIPREMFRLRRFDEVTVLMKVDGVSVGEAFLTKGVLVSAASGPTISKDRVQY